MFWNSGITEVNDFKNIYITAFRFTFLSFSNANSKFFTIMTFNSKGRTRSIFKRNVKMKAWEKFINRLMHNVPKWSDTLEIL